MALIPSLTGCRILGSLQTASANQSTNKYDSHNQSHQHTTRSIHQLLLTSELGKWIQFDANTGEVESLLYSDFFIWEHPDGSQDIGTERYHVPARIREHIDYVTPGTRLRSRGAAGPKKEKPKRGNVTPAITPLAAFPNPNSTSCDKYVTAECTRSKVPAGQPEILYKANCCAVQYNIPKGTTAVVGNELGIFEAQNIHYSRADLDTFWSTLYP